MSFARVSGRGLVLLACALAITACSFRSTSRAPVEDRTAGVPPPPAPGVVTPAPRQPPGFENAGKPGYYTVKPGDTLIRIGIEHGQSYRDIARWNSLDNPNLIEVGQVLRVVPPVDVAVAVARPVALPGATPASVPPAPAQGAASAPAQGAASAPVRPAAGASGAASAGDEPPWLWPASGPVVASFDEARNIKGLGIGGKAGDPVVAAADGRVIYAGSGLRGYGNLIILKHNNTYLTAYAHNQALLVKEEDTVRRGQKIAEMGSTDADRVKLHFEIRRQGKPVDPATLLPTR